MHVYEQEVYGVIKSRYNLSGSLEQNICKEMYS